MDVDDSVEADKTYEIVKMLGLNIRVVKTTRGKHFIFKKSPRYPLKGTTKEINAFGFTFDIRIGVNQYIVCKYGGKVREVVQDFDETKPISEFHHYFIPLRDKKDRHVFTSMTSGSGRNGALYSHIPTLIHNGFLRDEVEDILHIINEYVFDESMSDSEMRTILRNEAFENITYHSAEDDFKETIREYGFKPDHYSDLGMAILIPVTQLIAKILQVVAKILQLVIGLIVQIIEAVIELIDGVLNILIEIINVIVDILGAVINVVVTLLDILVDILEPILEIILAILEPLIEFISGIIEIIASLFEVLMPLIEIFLTPIMDILDVIFEIIEAISPILVIIGNVIKAVILPVLQLLMQILKPILDILSTIIDAIKWILDHTVGCLIKLIEKMFGTGDFDAENTVKTTSNSYMNTDNSRTTNNVTINTSGDVDIDSINEALGGAY